MNHALFALLVIKGLGTEEAEGQRGKIVIVLLPPPTPLLPCPPAPLLVP
jgi:hypothetical protein